MVLLDINKPNTCEECKINSSCDCNKENCPIKVEVTDKTLLRALIETILTPQQMDMVFEIMKGKYGGKDMSEAEENIIIEDIRNRIKSIKTSADDAMDEIDAVGLAVDGIDDAQYRLDCLLKQVNNLQSHLAELREKVEAEND